MQKIENTHARKVLLSSLFDWGVSEKSFVKLFTYLWHELGMVIELRGVHINDDVFLWDQWLLSRCSNLDVLVVGGADNHEGHERKASHKTKASFEIMVNFFRTDVIQRRFVNTMILCHVNFIPDYFKAGWHINTNYGDFSHVTVKKLKMGRVPIGICFLKSK